MTTTYDTYFSEVTPHCPNCPEIAMFNAIRNAAIEFCDKTWYLTHDCYPIIAEEGIGVYTPDTPAGTKMIGLFDIFYDERPMYPKDEDTLRRMYGLRDFRHVHGTPRWFYQKDPNEVTVVPMPDKMGAGFNLRMRIALAPLRASTSAADSLYERYAETIAMGALSRLKSVPNQPYSNPQEALALQRLWGAKLAEVRSYVERSKTRGPMAIRFNGRNT